MPGIRQRRCEVIDGADREFLRAAGNHRRGAVRGGAGGWLGAGHLAAETKARNLRGGHAHAEANYLKYRKYG